jgi:hypothetical protein
VDAGRRLGEEGIAGDIYLLKDNAGRKPSVLRDDQRRQGSA